MAKKRIESPDGWPKMGPIHKKLKTVLDEALFAGEQVLGSVVGDSNQTAIATNNRVIILKKGLMVGAPLGVKVAAYDYRSILGIELNANYAFGLLQIVTAGTPKFEKALGTSLYNEKTLAMMNMVTFGRTTRKEFTLFSNKISAMVSDATQTSAKAQDGNVALPLGPLDALKDLNSLLESKLINTEEFEMKRQEILKRI